MRRDMGPVATALRDAGFTEDHAALLVEQLVYLADDAPLPATESASYRAFLDIVEAAGADGITPYEARRALETRLGQRLSAVALYSWRERGTRDGWLMPPTGCLADPLIAVDSWRTRMHTLHAALSDPVMAGDSSADALLDVLSAVTRIDPTSCDEPTRRLITAVTAFAATLGPAGSAAPEGPTDPVKVIEGLAHHLDQVHAVAGHRIAALLDQARHTLTCR